jgi:threonyl-tRNA synthetase
MLMIAVVGEKELQNQTVNVRTRDNKVHGEHAVTHVLERFKFFSESKIVDPEEKF